KSAAFPVHTARTRKREGAFGPFRRIDEGWRRVHRSYAITLDCIQRHLLELRRVVDQVAFTQTLSVHCGGLRREWLRRRSLFTLDVTLWNRTFFDRPDGIAIGSIEDKGEGLLRQLNNRFDRFAVNSDVGKDRRGRHVVVPDVVMSQLVVPDAFACLD